MQQVRPCITTAHLSRRHGQDANAGLPVRNLAPVPFEGPGRIRGEPGILPWPSPPAPGLLLLLLARQGSPVWRRSALFTDIRFCNSLSTASLSLPKHHARDVVARIARLDVIALALDASITRPLLPPNSRDAPQDPRDLTL
ncbi:hypothetical protein CPLU01_00174 [Colletotrichum plurivorum]|uniref:Uncharacterized protein n=1 Tax=Colletotrichum plurivorum TaxID=2175906 RepID=A0A8H6U6H8_9PEZI|nr:hypothetical protein CPLU01_00174 [Colletotrichum plurivorum]